MKKTLLALQIGLMLLLVPLVATAIPLGTASVMLEGISYGNACDFMLGLSEEGAPYTGWHYSPAYEPFFSQRVLPSDVGRLYSVSNLAHDTIYPVLINGKQDLLAYAMGWHDPSPISLEWTYLSGASTNNNGIDFNGYDIDSISLTLMDFQIGNLIDPYANHYCSTMAWAIEINGRPILTPEPGTLLLTSLGSGLAFILVRKTRSKSHAGI
jgi:hypothetical protein